MTAPHCVRARPAALLGLLVAVACGGADEPHPVGREMPRGAQLVAGSSQDDWGLLVIPRAGGPASLRSLRDPTVEVWAGRTSLPASEAAHALEDGLVLLRDARGEVYRWDPGADRAEGVGRIGTGAKWVSVGRAGLFLDREGREVLSVSRSGSWRYAIPHPVEWASPLEPGAMTLLVRAPGGRQVWVLRQGEERPVATLEAPVGPPGVVTAWGKRVALAAGEEREAIQVLTVAPLASAGRIDVGDALLALAGSPSTHEIYAAVDGPPRLRAVNRFSGDVRDLGRFRGPVRAVRSLPFGDPLLAHDGTRTYRLPVGGGDPEPLDAEWRADLPVALPGGRVLFVRGGSVRLASRGGSAAGEPVDGPADAWWLAVHWSPAPVRLVAGEVRGEPFPQAGAPATPARADGGEAGRSPRPAASPPEEGATAGGREDAPGGTRDGPAGAGREGREDPSSDDADEDREPRGPTAAPGFYAIVGSARSPEGIRALTGELAAAGYPTALQAVPDDAGEIWHRGLVGPFRSRAEADAAARQLERERRLHAWVTEIALERGSGADGG